MAFNSTGAMSRIDSSTFSPNMLNSSNASNATVENDILLSILQEFVYFLNTFYKIFIIVFGLIGNTITIIIFKRTKLAHSKLTSFYLISLAMSDIIFLLVLLTEYLTINSKHSVICKISIYIPYMMTFLSCGLVLAFTVQRLCCIRFPLRVDIMNLESHSKAIVASLVIFAGLFYLYPLSIFDLNPAQENGKVVIYCMPKTGLESNIELFNFVDSVFTFCIPFLGILIMNGMIIQTLKNSSYNFILKSANNRHLNNENARPGAAPMANGNTLAPGVKLNTSGGSSTVAGQMKNDINGNLAQFKRLNECVQAGIGTAVVYNNNSNNGNNNNSSSPELNGGNARNGNGNHRKSYPIARYSFKFSKKENKNENIQLNHVLPSVNIIENSSSNGNMFKTGNDGWSNGKGLSPNNNSNSEAMASFKTKEHSFNHRMGCEKRSSSNETRNQRDSSSFIDKNRPSSRDRSDKKRSKCSCFLPLTTSPPAPNRAEKSKPYQSMFVSNLKCQASNGTSREVENLLRKSDQDENSLSRAESTKHFSVASNNMTTRNTFKNGSLNLNQNTQINFKKDGRHSVSLASTRRVNGIPDHSYSLRLNGNNHQNNEANSLCRNSFKSGGQKTSSVSRKITKMLIIVSSTFLLLNLPVHAFNVYSYVKYSQKEGKDKEYTQTEYNLIQIFQNMFYTSFSCNFLLYSISGVTFRTEFKQLLVKFFKGRFDYFK